MSLYFFNYETARTDNERKLSAEQLLTIFNRNIVKNAELLDYLGKKNIFGIISKSRNESTHSRFVAELLSGTFFNGDSRESTLLHFLDIILYRAGKENKVAEVNEHLRRAILTRSVMFERVETECELSVWKYQKEYSKFTTQASAEKDDRLDIYLKFKLQTPIAGRHELEIFIENKVNALEHDAQTERYFEACNNCGHKRPFQLFVYMTPHPFRDMDHYEGLNRKMRPECPHYIHICYQDIVDYVIEPLLIDEGLDTDKRNMLREYVSCLELPAMPDSESEHQQADLSIMAIGSRERHLVRAFMEDDVNRWLISKAVEAKLGEEFYSVGRADHLLNSADALQSALQVIINLKKKPLDILRCVADCNMIGSQNGSDPVLIYSPKGWRHNRLCKYLPWNRLFVCQGKVYASVGEALAAGIVEYKKKHKMPIEQLEQAFSGIYSAKGGGVPLVSSHKQKGNMETAEEGVYVRRNVAEERLQDINAVLGNKLAISPIENDMFMALMQCNTQVFLDVPVTENALPREIDDLVDDVTGYLQVGDTDFFCRADISGDRILKLNQIHLLRDHELIEKCEDTSILLDFFRSRKNLVLSVYKILLEAERNNEVYEEKLKTYRKLTKQ